MKRVLFSFMIGAFLLALPGSALVWGKAHVPLDQVQVCHRGEVKNVSQKALERFLRKGACRLPACDFAQVFLPENDCSAVEGDEIINFNGDAGSDGFCDGITVPLILPADGSDPTLVPTARCSNPF